MNNNVFDHDNDDDDDYDDCSLDNSLSEFHSTKIDNILNNLIKTYCLEM